MATWRHSAAIAIAASALAVFPYVLFNIGLIASARGSIVHMAPGEWAIVAAVLSLFLWLGSAAVFTLSAVLTRHQVWLSAPLALLVFIAFAAWLEPDFRTDPFDPGEHGLGYWVFVQGVLSTFGVLLLAWLRTPEVTLD